MSATIWYISKYVTPPYAAKVGSRGFFILREFARLGHSVFLFTSDSNHLAEVPKLFENTLHEIIEGVHVHWLRTLKYRGARSVRRIISWIDFEFQFWKMEKRDLPSPDVVIVSSLSLLTVLNGLWLKRRYKCKLVFEVRDIWPMTLIETGGFSSANPLVLFLGWLERLGYENADLIVGTMPNLIEHVTEVTGVQRLVVCVPQGLDSSLLLHTKPASNGYIESYFPAGKFIVCHAGSIGADNSLDVLIACARDMQDRDDVHFLIVGEGYLKADLQRQTKNLTNFTFAPAVPKAEVQSILQRSDLLYFAAKESPVFRFGQSLNKVIDYMLSAKPILASYSGFQSMINEAQCGNFVAAGNVVALRLEIERYARMPATDRLRIGARGRKWLIENRRFETLAQNYLQHLGLKDA